MNPAVGARMRRLACFSILGLLVLPLGLLPGVGFGADDEEGFGPIFDGATLDGWDGNPKFWSVEDGAITGQTTEDNPTKGNTFIIWRGGKPADFELKVEYRLYNHNSGIQFRSWEEPEKWGRWVVGGYQADLADNVKYDGMLYGERYRGFLAQRGEATVIGDDHKAKVVGKVGDPETLLSYIKRDGWNAYHIIAKGNRLSHSINGHQMVECTDNDTKLRRREGIIALQLHAGDPMKVQFRNIRLKILEGAEKKTSERSGNEKMIVFIAGGPSHAYGAHEHNAGCLLLAKWLNENTPGVRAVVHRDGWPKDPAALEGAATIVIYSDGGGRHPAMGHLDALDRLMKKGIGLACLHYAVEIPKGIPGDHLKDWIGGYFETHWSVNPFWTAEFKSLPEHPITRGVKPFAIEDEWYYHMRFQEDMKGVTPILTAVPPDSTRQRPDGPHSNNPTVRSRMGMPEHVGWVYERPDGGRGFGFTGGHWHWSWANDNFRTVVLGGIAWTAGLEIPPGGVPSKAPTFAELEANQDKPQPRDFDRARWQKLVDQWRRE